ncbi:helix-turn-helix domain-containing protein [Streptomyces sp. NBC_01298]|uniref:helix-turn-helix domain-containing protein n=1 Tax=Streptomyces sp. NBC_01298 TaxID=2903817 RepID=UPI002E0DB39B|nr:helix-turn-helix domain-containing protein [Streptomyces sp. NBC_01298]
MHTRRAEAVRSKAVTTSATEEARRSSSSAPSRQVLVSRSTRQPIRPPLLGRGDEPVAQALSALTEGRDRVEAAALFRVSVRAVDDWWARWQAELDAETRRFFRRRLRRPHIVRGYFGGPHVRHTLDQSPLSF